MDGVGGEDALVPEALKLARRSSSSSGATPTSRSRRNTDAAASPPSFPSSLPPSGLTTPLHPLTAAAVGQLGSPLIMEEEGREGGREGCIAMA